MAMAIGIEFLRLSTAHVLVMALILLPTAQSHLPALEFDKNYLRLFLQTVLSNSSAQFNFSTTPCEWTGVECSAGRHSHIRVRRIDLQSSGLNGSIPENTLSRLDALTHLNLFNNSLSGQIPTDLLMLSSLIHLNLSNNKFSGAVSLSKRNFSRLRSVDLSQNRLSGSLNFSSDSCINLSFLNLSSNSLSGSIPLELYNFTELQVLDLSFNSFTGNLLPDGLGNLFHLRILTLASNSFHGCIPSSVSNLHCLHIMDLSSNNFSGSLPNLQGLDKLQTLNLSQNNLTGMLPPPFFLQLPSLESASLRDNHFSEQLPTLTSNNSSLITLDFGRNLFTGKVPDIFWAFPRLQMLRLDHNKFSGDLPGSVCTDMVRVELNNNCFEGNMTKILKNWNGLEFLDLSSNKLTGSISDFRFSNWTKLRHLSIADNKLSSGGFLPLGEFLMLEFLNLSRMNMHGVIPENIGNLKRLIQLDLSHNLLHGKIPSSLGNLTSLLLLDLSYNELSGSISSRLSSLTSLRHLNISHNHFSGRIPWKGFDTSSFVGNQGLCGPSLNRNCSASAPPSSPESKGSHHRKFITILGAVMGGAGAMAGFVAFSICCRRSKQLKQPPNKLEKNISSTGPFSSEIDPSQWASGIPEPASIPVVMFEKPLLSLTFTDLLLSASNFSRENQIADGRHGAVFQGIVPGGSHIAIRILVDQTPQSEDDLFIRKLEAIGNLRHPNIVPLLGYCLIGVEKLILYKFIDNGDLHSQLHDLQPGIPNTEDWSRDTWDQVDGDVSGEPHLTWPIRHKIALGTARALAFLHHGCSPQIAHHAVKSSNILLDSAYEPHLADTGLSWLMAENSDSPSRGMDLGYAPPEYLHIKEATTRGDVYSFGVILMELVTGKRPSGDYIEGGNHRGDLVPWLRSLIRDKHGIKALDPKLAQIGQDSEMLETLRIAYLCTAESPVKRPTMQQIVGLLKDLRPE